MKKKSNKLKKIENKRYSIFTDDFRFCYCCGSYGKMDKHEIYGGANRQTSIKNGFVVPLCRKCHSDNKVINYLKKYCQKQFERKRTREDFIKIMEKVI